MRKFITCFQLSLFVLWMNGMAQVPFTAGNIVVYRVGTGTTNLTAVCSRKRQFPQNQTGTGISQSLF